MALISEALDELQRRERASGESQSVGEREDWGETLSRERIILVDWAKEEEIAFDEKDWLTRVTITRGEHHVFFDAEKQRYFKITHDSKDPDKPGFAIVVDVNPILGRNSQKWISVPYIRDATPFEYLRRLVLFNRVFGDVIQIEGVICDPGREAIVTSQPVIRGHAATDAEVADAMHKLGFSLSDCPPLGKNDVSSQSFYNAVEKVAVFDTHGENFLVGDSIVTPIDALIVVADEDLLRYMTCSRAERRKEIGLQTSGLLGI